MNKECEKIPFNSKEEAREELKRIVEETTFKPWKHTKPCRYYFCKYCSTEGQEVWHLTSKIGRI